MEPLKHEIQDRLRDLGRTQRDIARGLGLDPSAVTLLLAGKRQVLLSEVPVIARVLEVSKAEACRLLGVPVADDLVELQVVGRLDGDRTVKTAVRIYAPRTAVLDQGVSRVLLL